MVSSYSFGQEDSIILEIRKNFNTWQPIINEELKVCDRLFNYRWGENYQFNEWFDTQLTNYTLTLSDMALIIEKEDLGTFLYMEKFSLAGDWFIAIDYCFDTNGKLYFIFWRMNTFQADEPVTVEKRLYFDQHGEKIRSLVSVFKMNTNEEENISFSDREVEYKIDIREFEIFDNLKSK